MKRLLTITTVATLLFAGQAFATLLTEVGDVGQTLGDTGSVPDGTTQIDGRAGPAADLWEFNWAGGEFEVDTQGSSINDTQLFLFDSTGAGVWANDDFYGLLSRIYDAALAAGTYYIGITAWDLDPVDSGANLIFASNPFGDQFGPNAGAGTLSSWSGPIADRSVLGYSINFNRATSVPEPGTLALLGLGLIGMAARRRKTV